MSINPQKNKLNKIYMINDLSKKFFDENGYLVIKDVISSEELDFYDKTYNAFINNEFDIGCCGGGGHTRYCCATRGGPLPVQKSSCLNF